MKSLQFYDNGSLKVLKLTFAEDLCVPKFNEFSYMVFSYNFLMSLTYFLI